MPRRPGWTLAWELEVRSGWQPVMDACLAHELLEDPYWEHLCGSQVWLVMAQIARGLLHQAPDWQDPGLTWDSVVNHLGHVSPAEAN